MVVCVCVAFGLRDEQNEIVGCGFLCVNAIGAIRSLL